MSSDSSDGNEPFEATHLLFSGKSPSTPPGASGSSASTPDAPSPETLRFGRYEVLLRETPGAPGGGVPYELGRGGMGVTYKGFDPGLGKRTVVLKVINAMLLGKDPKARERFRREAGVAAQLHHPHIAAVFDIGEERGEDYYVMEFIAGEDLLTRLRRVGKLDAHTALQITRQVLEALDAAWERSIVHRDIKPGNLMLANRAAGREAREGPLVKVVDFGLAKALKAAVRESGDLVETSEQVTTAARALFSPAYASPEQIEDELVDVRSDLYSLGITLWQMLTGQPTFGITSYQKTIVGHLSKAPPVEDLRAVDVPESVIGFLGHLLEKSPADRPQSPEAALAELDAVMRGESAQFFHEPPGGADPAAEAEIEAPSAQLDATLFYDGARPALAGDILGGRYCLNTFVGESSTGRVFRASDLQAESAPVALKILDGGLLAAAPADFFTLLREKIVHAQSAPHPGLRSVYGRATGTRGEGLFVISEWIDGFTLLALLRRRSHLSARETLLVGRQLAEAADHAAAHGLDAVEYTPHQIFLHFPGGLNADAAACLPGVPLADWPPFVVKLDPLAILPVDAPVLGDHTQVDARAVRADGNPVRALARLMYELLSGAPPTSYGTYTPLPAWNEAANEALRDGLSRSSRFGSAVELCDAIAAVAGPMKTSPPPAAPKLKSAPALFVPVAQPAPIRAPELAALVVADVLPLPASPISRDDSAALATQARPDRKRLFILAAVVIGALLIVSAGVVLWQHHHAEAVAEARRRDERAAEQHRQAALAQAVQEKAAKEAEDQAKAARAREDKERERQAALEKSRLETARTNAEDEKARLQRAAQEKETKLKLQHEAEQAAAKKALDDVLKSAPGDEVVAVRETSLSIQGQPQRKVNMGERFRVLRVGAKEGFVYVPALDAAGHPIGGIALSLPASALQAVGISVGGMLRQAVDAAQAGNYPDAERLLARVARAAPDEPAVGRVRNAIGQVTAAQTALNQAQQAVQATVNEVARLRKNALTIDHPNPLDGNTGGQVRAMAMRAQADTLEHSATDGTSPAATALEAAKTNLGKVELPAP